MGDTMRDDRVGGVPVRIAGELGPTTLLVTGPPAGASLFRAVQARMLPRRTAAVELLASGAVGLDALAEKLQVVLDELGAEVLFAHGLALPVAARVRCQHLVASNGPVTRFDAVSRGLALLPERLLAQGLFRPAVARRWLASSGGLRRTVNNPYVMDRDIVVMLTETLVGSPAARRVGAVWLRSAGHPDSLVEAKAGVVSAIWGDHDGLYPLYQTRGLCPADQLHVVPGGRHYFVEERPWEVADRLLAITTT